MKTQTPEQILNSYSYPPDSTTRPPELPDWWKEGLHGFNERQFNYIVKACNEYTRALAAKEESRRQCSELIQANDRLLAQRDQLREALIWIKDVVSERKGLTHWLQMIEDKCRNAIAKCEASNPTT